jgi:hypothetical protein
VEMAHEMATARHEHGRDGARHAQSLLSPSWDCWSRCTPLAPG